MVGIVWAGNRGAVVTGTALDFLFKARKASLLMKLPATQFECLLHLSSVCLSPARRSNSLTNVCLMDTVPGHPDQLLAGRKGYKLLDPKILHTHSVFNHAGAIYSRGLAIPTIQGKFCKHGASKDCVFSARLMISLAWVFRPLALEAFHAISTTTNI